jgi:outer membrane lipoprotein SlyB
MSSALRLARVFVVLVAVGWGSQINLCHAQGSWSSSPQVPASQPANQSSGGVYGTHFSSSSCVDCGRVTAITVSEKPVENATLGMVAGGVAGAVLGRQMGAGRGKDVATIAGAVGGAYAGKKIQENMGLQKNWTVSVTYNDGRNASFDFEQDPGWVVGDSVRSAGKTLVRQ